MVLWKKSKWTLSFPGMFHLFTNKLRTNLITGPYYILFDSNFPNSQQFKYEKRSLN